MRASVEANRNPEKLWFRFRRDLNAVYLPQIIEAKDAEALNAWRDGQLAHKENLTANKYLRRIGFDRDLPIRSLFLKRRDFFIYLNHERRVSKAPGFNSQEVRDMEEFFRSDAFSDDTTLYEFLDTLSKDTLSKEGDTANTKKIMAAKIMAAAKNVLFAIDGSLRPFLWYPCMAPVTLAQLAEVAQKSEGYGCLPHGLAAVLTKRFERDPALKHRLLSDVCQLQPANANIPVPHTELHQILISGDPKQPIIGYDLDRTCLNKKELDNPTWGYTQLPKLDHRIIYEGFTQIIKPTPRVYDMNITSEVLEALDKSLMETYFDNLRQQFKESFKQANESVFSKVAADHHVSEDVVKEVWEAYEQQVLAYYQTVEADEIKKLSPDGVISEEKKEAARSEAHKQTCEKFNLHVKYQSIWDENRKRIIMWPGDTYPVPLDQLTRESSII